MPCGCCETGRCCSGGNKRTCTATTKSECNYLNGSNNTPFWTAGLACESRACVSSNAACELTNFCNCNYSSRTWYDSLSTCNCNTLTAAGVSNGGCPINLCQSCDSGTGTCVPYCTGTCRVCCQGVCCPESQSCSGAICVDKCAAGTTYCRGINCNVYACCSPGQKCCGSSGCLAQSTLATPTVDVAVNTWVDTGLTLAANQSIELTATASGGGVPGTVQWLGAGSTATPDGVTSGACGGYRDCDVLKTACHMALIASIGSPGAAPFLVGSSYRGTPGAGRLYLRQNDTCIGDNLGTYSVTIKSDPCPGYTPQAVGEAIVISAGTPDGPGATLKWLLKLGGIVASPTCSCNARAAQMDQWGEWECLKRLPEICGWLREEAKSRDLWYFAPAGGVLILAAISLSALKRPFRGNNR